MRAGSTNDRQADLPDRLFQRRLIQFSSGGKTKSWFPTQSYSKGQKPTDLKPMPTIGKGTEELRIWTGDAYRVFYVARFEEAVYVLHSFQKRHKKRLKKILL